MRYKLMTQHFAKRRNRIQFVLSCVLALGAGAAQPASDPTRFSLEELMKLTVVGGAKYDQRITEVAAATSVITREEIKVFGWTTLAQALVSLPGMHTTYDRQYQYLGTRGLGLPGDYNTRVLVMINGNRINDPVYDQGPVGWDFPLDLDLVERIEFIPGPGSAIYGQNAMLGVVNVITRNGADLLGGRLAVDWQHPQQATETRLTLGRELDNGANLLLAASARNSRGEDLPMAFGGAGQSGVATALDGETVRRVFSRLGSGAWSVDLLHADRIKNDPTASYQSVPLLAGQFSQDRYALLNLQYQERFSGDQLQFTGRVFAGSYRYDSRLYYLQDLSGMESPGMGDWRGLELRWLATHVPRHKLLMGLEHQDSTRIEQQNLYPDDPARNLSIRSAGHRSGVYIQDEWALRPDLTAIYGLRFDSGSNASSKSSPRAGLIWKLSDDTTLKGLLGRAYRNPNAYERDYQDGATSAANPGLVGESISTAELVADHRLDRDTQLRASLYEWRIDNMITQANLAGANDVTQYQTGQALKTTGLALSADRTWPDGSRLRASWSWQQALYADGTVMPNSPNRLLKLLVSKPLPALGLHLGYELYADSSRLALDGSRLGGYGVSNLFLRWDTPVHGWEFGLGISNLFDKRYEQPVASSNWQNALMQDGRSWRVQSSYRFH